MNNLLRHKSTRIYLWSLAFRRPSYSHEVSKKRRRERKKMPEHTLHSIFVIYEQ